jgi:DNA mismatch repair protein MutS2
VRRRDLKALEFDLVVNRVADFAVSPGGKQSCRALLPAAAVEEATSALDIAWQCLRLIERNGALPLGEFPDIRASLGEAAHEGFLLDGKSLLEVRTVLQAARDAFAFLNKHARDLPNLEQLPDRLVLLPALRATLERTLDADGQVTDDASDELAAVRRTLRLLRERVTKRLDQLLTRPGMEDLLSDRYVTLRNNRFVIPVKTAAAPQVSGVVQDRSVSGETTFIEPLFAVEMNNQLLMAAKDEERLVRRVLADLTALVRDEVDSLRATYDVLVDIDVLHARARFAQLYGCTQPHFDADEVKLTRARHPGLMVAERDVVPIDLLLPRGKRVLVISGPNTGGKTVALKTLGLLSLMAQSGILIPAAEGSSLPCFDAVFADVGDEQSIEHSLSTFSAHLANLVDILRHGARHPLVLLDEPGVGTDPEEGAALGIGVIRTLRDLGAHVAVSTHFSAVKVFALSDESCVTAAVQFHLESMSPRYALSYHSVGESMAFPIARRLGLPEATLRTAEAAQSESARTLASAMARLEAARRRYEERLAAIEKREVESLRAQRESNQLLAELREKRKQRWADELRQARGFVREVRERGRRLLDEIAQGEANRRALERFVKEEGSAIAERERSETDEPAPAAPAPAPGEQILVANTGIRGELLSVQGERAWIQRGSMRFEVPAKELRKVTAVTAPAAEVVATHHSPPPEDAARELNLVGLRTREAQSELDAFLDRAARSGYPSVRIIHGVGSGALRRAVADYLSMCPYCTSFRAGEPNEGGAGVTIAALETT